MKGKIPGKGNDKTEHWGKWWGRLSLASSALASTMAIDSTALSVPPTPFWSSAGIWNWTLTFCGCSEVGTTELDWGQQPAQFVRLAPPRLRNDRKKWFTDTILWHLWIWISEARLFKLIVWALNRCANPVSVCFWREGTRVTSFISGRSCSSRRKPSEICPLCIFLHWGKTKDQETLSKILKILVLTYSFTYYLILRKMI